MNIKDGAMVLILSFAATAILGKIAIPILKQKHIGQNIREDGPQSHLSKEGTPTMGGVIIVATLLIGSLLFVKRDSTMAVLLFGTLSFGGIGFFDDFMKLFMKRSLGLTARQKILLQVACSLILVLLAQNALGEDGFQLYVPFLSKPISLGGLTIPVLMFVVVATTNAVNLTDGLDGLASGVTLPVVAALGVMALSRNETVTGFSVVLFGAILGFLLYNSNPAAVFMGDTGSMALGGAVVSMALMLNVPLYIPILGGIYFVEALSVILQVLSYKLRNKKRIFLMSPIHHHYELKGYEEQKIVTTFTIISILLSCLSLFLYF
jgi:phospho-N-acetylmuramoyl-pentapeptide-transferase